MPPQLAQIILKALAKNPADRFPSAQQFLAALDAIRLDAVHPLDAVHLGETRTVAVPNLRPAAPEAASHPNSQPAAEASIHSAADLERASKDLASFIGPIAHILVRRAAPESRTLSDLYQTLAQEISSASKREQFLGNMPRAPVSRSTGGTPSAGSQTSG